MRAASSPLRRPAAPGPAAITRNAACCVWAAPGFAAAFFLGYLPGIWLGRGEVLEIGAQMAGWYLDKQSYPAFGPVLVANLAANAILQVTILFLCGLSAAGVPLLALFFTGRGCFMGLCAGSVFALGGAKSLVVYWLMHCLPDLGVLAAEMWMALYATTLSGGLFQEVFGSGAPRGMISGGMAETYLPPVVRTISALAFSSSSGCAMALAAVSAMTLAATMVPLLAMDEQDWAVICQLWPGVPSASVATLHCAVGAQ